MNRQIIIFVDEKRVPVEECLKGIRRVDIGRNPDVNYEEPDRLSIQLPSHFRAISRQQCSIILVEDLTGVEAILKDGRIDGDPSANGTWLNGRRIFSAKLAHKDRIGFSAHLDAYPYIVYRENNLVIINSLNDTLSHEYLKADPKTEEDS